VNEVKGLVEGYLTGQAGGSAMASILYGEVNPSAKLAETFPIKLAHNPSHLNFPGELDKVEYKEGIFVGYRYYDKKKMDVLFPFGHGLSYTDFEYSDFKLSSKEINDTDKVTVTVKVKNTGDIYGKEIVQLYVSDVVSNVQRPIKELKGFEKVGLNPGEEKEVSFELDKRSFAYYNVDIKDWYVESGDFEILIGKSSRDIVLKETIKVNSTIEIKKAVTKNTAIGDIIDHPAVKPMIDAMMRMFGEGSDGLGEGDMFAQMMKYMPLRALATFNPMLEDTINNLIKEINSENK